MTGGFDECASGASLPGRFSLDLQVGRSRNVAAVDGLKISDVAALTGFSASTLRFDDDSGLVSPGRTASGYRAYSDRAVESLRFIARAKRLGLSLEEITDLVALFDADRCAPMQERLRGLVDRKVIGAQEQIAELSAFVDELRRVRTGLDLHTPDGACDDECGCITPGGSGTAETVLISRKPSAHDRPSNASRSDLPIACTLALDKVDGRIGQWRALAEGATGTVSVDGGARLIFDRWVDLAPITELLAAEQDCCRFFTFGLTITATEVLVDITGPAAAEPLIAILLGGPTKRCL